FILGILLLFSISFANERHPEYSDRIEAHTPTGCVNYKFLFFRLYRAELWSDSYPLLDNNYGLTLIYDYEFSQHELVWASISEMARISNRPKSTFDSTRIKLEQIMRTVSKGDRFTAWKIGENALEFFFNGDPVGILDEEVDLFLAIWLSEKSRKPELAKRLLGGKCNS
ncbi:MAG: hypothetical protein OXE41_00665, partial [Gammaproteobacteria bacterium]|nr:hypothetical protein [Gammaproteobacteria bacterium]